MSREETLSYNQLLYQFNDNFENEISKTNKNKLIAFGLSGLFSGAGQFYLGDWKKGLIYSSIEVLEWAYRDNYLDKNDYYVKQYKTYGQENWSISKWINDYYLFNNPNSAVYEAFLNDSDNDGILDSYVNPWDDSHRIWFEYCETPNPQGCNSDNFINSIDQFSNRYQYICNDSELNGCDVGLPDSILINLEDINNDGTIDATDQIQAYIGDVLLDHHFYEGIGKYDLYFSGWSDATFSDISDSTDNSSFIVIQQNSSKLAVTAKKEYYEYTLRKKAKQKSDIAENALSAIFINHAISMLDVLLDKRKNDYNIDFSAYYNPNDNYKINGITIHVNF